MTLLKLLRKAETNKEIDFIHEGVRGLAQAAEYSFPKRSSTVAAAGGSCRIKRLVVLGGEFTSPSDFLD